MIFKRTYGGKREKTKQGVWTFQIPYGYTKNRQGFLELYEPEVKIIELIVKKYLDENLKV